MINSPNSTISPNNSSMDISTSEETLTFPSELTPIIQNIVSSVSLGIPQLDLLKIAISSKNTEYSPKKFAAVIMKLREPRSTGLIFRSGKLITTGTHCEADTLLASRKIARIIQKIGFDVSFNAYKIQNMVATTKVPFPIRLESLAHDHSEFCSYEPELFSGLIYRLVSLPSLVILVFVSGKIVITGAKNKNQINTAFSNIFPVLMGYRATNIYGDNNNDNLLNIKEKVDL